MPSALTALTAHLPPGAQVGGLLGAGFTLLELLLAVAILGVLMSVALPSFSGLLDNWRTRQAAEGLMGSLQLARSEAIKRGGRVIMQKLPNTSACAQANGNREWGCGWFICHDNNGNRTCDSDDPLLQHFAAPASLQICRRGGAATIEFNRWGLVQGAFPSFNFRPANQPLAKLPSARALRMSAGGRIRISADSTQEDTTCTG